VLSVFVGLPPFAFAIDGKLPGLALGALPSACAELVK
jgi:hypothetical protein